MNEGGDKVKNEKFQTHRKKFEGMKMTDEKNGVAYIFMWMKCQQHYRNW